MDKVKHEERCQKERRICASMEECKRNERELWKEMIMKK